MNTRSKPFLRACLAQLVVPGPPRGNTRTIVRLEIVEHLAVADRAGRVAVAIPIGLVGLGRNAASLGPLLGEGIDARGLALA
jgi:hypothetical protein